MGWTLGYADKSGRHSEVTTYAGAALPAAFGGANTNSMGTVKTDVDANTTTVEDQAGKKRRSVTNALGQLVRVDEPDGSGNLGTVASPNQPTSYSYDTLDNLVTVNQGVQTRTFTYNSLSRLMSATNPESGTISYSYDPNGNLTSKTDARSITTSYIYDALNRVTQRSYSGETGYTTPAVSYFYDNLTNAKGKLTKVSSSVSTTEYTSFDILGRVTGHKQTTDGNAYETAYAYNLSGALVEQTYPSGRVVKNTLDAGGSLAQVQSKKNSGDFYRPYASNFAYNAAGAVMSMRLGNGKFETTVFNSRLQPIQIGLGSSVSDHGLLKLDYSYGTTNNNGNVLSQTITVPTVGVNTGFVATQTYTYDSLNRIKDATENVTPQGGSSSQSWKQTFTYDRYGNRNFDEANTTTLPKSCLDGSTPVVCVADRKIVNPSVNTANNRMSTSDDYAFDSAGNTTEDAEGRTFVYDAENKQVSVSDTNGTIGEYHYDGDGRRVKKIVQSTGEVTIFVYDAVGKSIAEYSTVISIAPKVSYTTADHLGSPRVLTDENGQVMSRRDFHPFGEEIMGSGGRTQGLNYTADDVRQKFTGYERDDESSLDFAEARMYSPVQGRFGTCDPVYISKAHPGNPQRWNAYVYVFNNPLNKVDPDGRKPKTIDVYIAFDNYSADQIKEIQKALRKLVDPKKFTVNVYGWEQSTSDNVAESLRSKGRTVVVAGHINGIDGEETGEVRSTGKPKTAANSILLNGGLLRSDGIYNMNSEGNYVRVNSERIKADSLYVFSCGLTPKAASEFASRMETAGSFVYADGGDDTGTAISTAVNYAGGTVGAIGAGLNPGQTALALQNLSDQYEKQGVRYQNGDNIIPCQSNGTCAEKRHKLRLQR